LEAIQKQRKILSGINETEIVIESLMEDEDLSETFTRDMMIEEAQEVFDSFKELLVTFLGELEKQEISFDAVELVGGGSRIPKIIEIVQ
jgi:molecular chaperone DnaK (HSP70)